MARSTVIHAPADELYTEYTIYTYRNDSDSAARRWEKQNTFTDVHDAMRRAEAFYNTGEYSKVEIKHKTFDLNNTPVAGGMLKIYEEKRGGHIARRLGALGLAMVSAMAAIVGYYLNQG